MSRRILIASLCLIAALFAGACGKVSKDGGGSGDFAVAPKDISAEAPKSGCGSVPISKIDDARGLVKTLGAEQQAGMASYSDPVLPSTYANFEPKGKPPWDIAIVWGPLQSDSQSLILKAIGERLKQSPDVGSVSTSTLATLDTATQLQQLRSAADKNPDLIISQPGQVDSFKGPFKKLGQRGIPVVAVLGNIPIPEVINVDANNFAAGAETGAYAMRLIGEKGNVMYVNGINGIAASDQTVAAFDAVLRLCPNVKFVGQTSGAFSNATSKSETLRFLGTNPQEFSAVLQVANMAPGVMSAFQQAGRPMPVVNDIGQQKGSLGYWRQNTKSYNGVGAGLPPEQIGAGAADVALRVLGGQGIKLNTVAQHLPLITSGNLNDWSQGDWNLNTLGTALGPDNAFMTDGYLDGFFKNPSTPK